MILYNITMKDGQTTNRKTFKVGKRLHEITTVHDKAGNLLHKVIKPLMVQFRISDVLQVVLGSSLLAIPMVYTSETWSLGINLPLKNVIFLGIISIIFVAVFVYYNFYKHHFKHHFGQFILRTISIYIISFLTVSLLLILIEKAPWATDWLLALKRTIIVAVPASMSAAVADMIK